MKIALYGEFEEELSKRKTEIQNSYLAGDWKIDIDQYTEEDSLKENLSQYDIICMNDSLCSFAGIRKRAKVAFAQGKIIETCYVDEIYYAEAELKEVHIRYKKGEMIVHLPFGKVEQLLLPKGFLKVHRSFLVNCQHIKSINDGTVSLKNGVVLPISKYRMKEVRRAYLAYLGEGDEAE